MNKSPKHIRLLKMEIPETGTSSVVKEHHLPAASMHAPCSLVCSSQPSPSCRGPRCLGAIRVRPEHPCTRPAAQDRGFPVAGCAARRAISSAQLLPEQGLPSHACCGQGLCVRSAWQHKKQQNSRFFQAFPLPSAKGSLQKPGGSGLSTAAPSPGRRLVLAQLLRGWVLPARGALNPLLAQGRVAQGRVPWLPPSPGTLLAAHAPTEPRDAGGTGGTRVLALKCNPWVHQFDFCWASPGMLPLFSATIPSGWGSQVAQAGLWCRGHLPQGLLCESSGPV